MAKFDKEELLIWASYSGGKAYLARELAKYALDLMDRNDELEAKVDLVQVLVDEMADMEPDDGCCVGMLKYLIVQFSAAGFASSPFEETNEELAEWVEAAISVHNGIDESVDMTIASPRKLRIIAKRLRNAGRAAKEPRT